MWSVGCIFAELLSMIREHSPDYLSRKPIFPGKSCFPLSPDKSGRSKNVNGYPSSSTDQLYVIFQLLGSPTDNDQAFILDPLAKTYISNFPQFQRQVWEFKYPKASKEALDLLDKILVFNPYFRISIDAALEHPFFERIRRKELERSALNEIELEFDAKVNKEMSRERLREIMLDEIKLIKQSR